MSVIREIKINYDLRKLEEVCQELGLYVEKNVPIEKIKGAYERYYETVDLAVAKEKGDVFNFGFKQKDNDTYLIIDRYYADNNTLIENVITRYISNSLYPYYTVDEIKSHGNKEIVMIFKK